MEMAEVIILDAGWLFFAAWGMVLMAVSVMAFGREILGVDRKMVDRKTDRQSHEINDLPKAHEGNL
jgi:hypothetical protein